MQPPPLEKYISISPCGLLKCVRSFLNTLYGSDWHQCQRLQLEEQAKESQSNGDPLLISFSDKAAFLVSENSVISAHSVVLALLLIWVEASRIFVILLLQQFSLLLTHYTFWSGLASPPVNHGHIHVHGLLIQHTLCLLYWRSSWALWRRSSSRCKCSMIFCLMQLCFISQRCPMRWMYDTYNELFVITSLVMSWMTNGMFWLSYFANCSKRMGSLHFPFCAKCWSV